VRCLTLGLTLVFVIVGASFAAPRPVVLATTTSTYDSGLLDHLLPEFERRSEIDVKVVAVGTGQALALARRGDADVVLVHAPDLEREFVRQGHAAGRWRLMYNYFVLVGPVGDPARVRSARSAANVVKRIAAAGATFVSRGDQSGTHHRELKLWQEAKIKPQGDWYLESGSGMAAALRLADQKDAYTLSDLATYLAHTRRLRLTILYEKGRELLNPYSLMVVSPKAHPSINYRGAVRLVHYFLAPQTLRRIESFGADRFGRPLFYVYRRPQPSR